MRPEGALLKAGRQKWLLSWPHPGPFPVFCWQCRSLTAGARSSRVRLTSEQTGVVPSTGSMARPQDTRPPWTTAISWGACPQQAGVRKVPVRATRKAMRHVGNLHRAGTCVVSARVFSLCKTHAFTGSAHPCHPCQGNSSLEPTRSADTCGIPHYTWPHAVNAAFRTLATPVHGFLQTQHPTAPPPTPNLTSKGQGRNVY